jgi:hypothetical protein
LFANFHVLRRICVVVPGFAGSALAQGWVASGNNLLFNSGYVSIGSSATPFPLYVVGSGQTVIMGATNTPSGVSVGVWGQSSSSNGRGIYGYATSATGGSYGGLFRTLSNQGIGVFALADSPTGATTGIRGQSASVDGTGLWGSHRPRQVRLMACLEGPRARKGWG